jgi:hypothetical protein
MIHSIIKPVSLRRVIKEVILHDFMSGRFEDDIQVLVVINRPVLGSGYLEEILVFLNPSPNPLIPVFFLHEKPVMVLVVFPGFEGSEDRWFLDIGSPVFRAIGIAVPTLVTEIRVISDLFLFGNREHRGRFEDEFTLFI